MTHLNVSLLVLERGVSRLPHGTSVVLFCRSSWKWKSWISGGIRNGIRTGMQTTVVGSRRAVVLMAMTPTISTPRTTIITHIFHSHLSPPHRQDGMRIFCLGWTPPHLSRSLFNVGHLCCCFVDPLGSGKVGFLVGSGLGCPRV